jgi:putative endonuclease
MMNNKTSFYILYSKTLNKYYSGITSEDIQSRIDKHNSSYYGHKFTSAAKDWELRLEIRCESYTIARKTELYVKRMKSRKFIEKIITNEEERNVLIQTISST